MGSCLKKSKQGKKRKCLAKKKLKGLGQQKNYRHPPILFTEMHPGTQLAAKHWLWKKTLNRENINSLVKFETATLW
jgi:hypothetical protein